MLITLHYNYPFPILHSNTCGDGLLLLYNTRVSYGAPLRAPLLKDKGISRSRKKSAVFVVVNRYCCCCCCGFVVVAVAVT